MSKSCHDGRSDNGVVSSFGIVMCGGEVGGKWAEIGVRDPMEWEKLHRGAPVGFGRCAPHQSSLYIIYVSRINVKFIRKQPS